MEIRRAVSRGANWTLSLGHVPALLELIDEQQIPVDICLIQGAGTVSLRADSVHCRRNARSLILEVSGTSIEIDLDRLREARAVSRAAGSNRRISLQLVSESGAAWLTITGPAMGEGLAGQVWQLVMDSLLSSQSTARAQRAISRMAVPGPHSSEGSRPFEPTTLRAWTRATGRNGIAGRRLAVGSQG